MDTRTLTSAKGFLIVDLPAAEHSVGPARLGEKLVPSNAVGYAREVTYGFGLLQAKRGGATLGLKVSPDDREETVQAVAVELADELGDGRLMFDPGLRMPGATLKALSTNDPRPSDRLDIGDELEAAGIAEAATALLGDLDGKHIGIDGVNGVTSAAAALLSAGGASIVRVTDGRQTITGSIPASALAERLAGDAEALNSHGETAAAWSMWKSEGMDLAIAGSKIGALTHQGAGLLGDTPVVCYGVSPVSTKAIAMSRNAGGNIVPAFVTSLGRRIIDTMSSDIDGATLRSQAEEVMGGILERIIGDDAGPYLEACIAAEEFIGSWTERPFGRPMA
ncbi:MAG: hypothetical protein GY708_11605 [Actinomycetia bacterium]|nr:hypothetical protein [Actinomycetes bacterium]MCP4959382.1 hypothetical protein [Actinomycetes bacterium]